MVRRKGAPPVRCRSSSPGPARKDRRVRAASAHRAPSSNPPRYAHQPPASQARASRLSGKISRTWRITTLLVGIHSSRLLPAGKMAPTIRLHTTRNCARSSRNAARTILGTLRAIASESRARSNRNAARDDPRIRSRATPPTSPCSCRSSIAYATASGSAGSAWSPIAA